MKRKALSEVSERTKRRRRRELIDKHFENPNVNEDRSYAESSSDSDSPRLSPSPEVWDDEFELSEQYLFGESVDEFPADSQPASGSAVNDWAMNSQVPIGSGSVTDYCTAGSPSVHSYSSTDNDQPDSATSETNDGSSSSGLSELSMKIVNELVEMWANNRITKAALSTCLKLIDLAAKNPDQMVGFPPTFYKLEKVLKSPLSAQYHVLTDCCKKPVSNYKNLDRIRCECGSVLAPRSVIPMKDRFFRFSLKQQLSKLLNTFALSNSYPGEIFEKFLDLKKEICSITIFTDGVPLSNGNGIWTLFVKVNNLECPINSKVFLNSCYYGSSKPVVEFFVKDLIEELNSLYAEGILLRNGKRVFVVLTLFLLDSAARPAFLCHTSFNGSYGCLTCLAEGKVIKSGDGWARVYTADEPAAERTLESHRDCLLLIANGHSPPVLGVKDRSPICNLSYFNYISSTPLEAMHMLKGIFERTLTCIASEKGFRCFVNRSTIEKLEKRIQFFSSFTFNDLFKRPIDTFENMHRSKCKTNQIFQFWFYLFPVVFESLIDRDVYLHSCVLIFIVSNLWYKPTDQVDLNLINKLIRIYHRLIAEFYPENTYTMNFHLLVHIARVYRDHGPFSLNNAFFFEHLNGLVKAHAVSGWGALEQIADKSTILFETNLKSTSCNRPLRLNRANDCFVMVGNSFYKITRFHNENGIPVFDAFEFKVENKFTFQLDFTDFDLGDLELLGICLDYMYTVRLTDTTVTLNVNQVTEKVLFCPRFDPGKATVSDQSKGLIIRCLLDLHN